MFDYIYQWLENLAFYMILVTAVLQVLPNNSYQKYIRFFAGLILVIILMGPILRIAGMEEKLGDIYKSTEYRQQTREIEEASSFLENIENPLWEGENQNE